MSKIKSIETREIKDSRGNPVVEVELKTERGSFMASCEKGIAGAIEIINTVIAKKLKGKDPAEQKILDDMMIGFETNTIFPVSVAICRAGAAAEKLSLYQYIANLAGVKPPQDLPLPSFSFLDFQEFMVVPQKKLFFENFALTNKIFQNVTEVLIKNYGKNPAISIEQALYLLKNAIGNAEAKIAVDAADSEFYKDGKYLLEGKEFSRQELINFYKDLVVRFPIIFIEDPFAKEDWEGFREITKELPNIAIIGDDLTATNVKKIKEARGKNACNGVVIKPNQVGMVSEAIEAANLAKSFNWKVIASHRSGETMDTFIADFAVGIGADFIKAGSPSQEESMVKYRRLLEIESELHKK